MLIAAPRGIPAQDATSAAATEIVLAPPAAPVPEGATVRVGLYVRNSGATPLDFVPPARVDAELVTANARHAVALERVLAEVAARPLAPGETAHAEYELALPDDVVGRVVLQTDRLTAAPVVLDVERREPPVDPPDEAGVQAPLDPESAPPAPEPFRFAEAAVQRFRPYEPMYFLVGGDRPNARFQFSFQYRFFNPEGPWASEAPLLSGLYLGYTQTSLWDLEGSSKPFTDTNYRPEFGWSTERVDAVDLPGVAQTGFQFGYQHESNGRDGDASRSLHMLFAQPVVHFGDPRRFEAQVAPRVYVYLDDEDNPDIQEYRGWCDLRVSARWARGFQAAAIARLGSDGDQGSLQVDLTYPLRALGDGNFDLFLQLQWFSGYGESLISYDRDSDALRVGIAFVR